MNFWWRHVLVTQGNNAVFEYSLVGAASKFSVTRAGDIVVSGLIDRETQDTYSFEVSLFSLTPQKNILSQRFIDTLQNSYVKWYARHGHGTTCFWKPITAINDGYTTARVVARHGTGWFWKPITARKDGHTTATVIARHGTGTFVP